MRKAVTLITILATVTLFIPAAIVLPFSPDSSERTPSVEPSQPQSEPENHSEVIVRVHRTATNTIERVTLSNYLVGVVAAEMPSDFHIEALKAQAMAARTYVVRRLVSDPSSQIKDNVDNQAYKNKDEWRKLWGNQYDKKMKKIEKAVSDTDNLVITYHHELISPVFFSTGNGRTEYAGDYWQTDVPYLKSVESPWDKKSPKYEGKKRMKRSEVEEALGIELKEHAGGLGKVVKKTRGGRVAVFEIGGKRFSGREIREKLDLSSTDFQFEQNGNDITVTTLGNGHGVGMSQYGANGMAGEGRSAEQIVAHYYPGSVIAKMTVDDSKPVSAE